MATPFPASGTWIGDRPAVQAHLNIIETVIARMATSSASCKTWCLALVGAVTSLAGASHQPAVLGYVVVVLAIFWFLDVRYLAQEKAFRNLFADMVAKIRDDSYAKEHVFEMSAEVKRHHLVDALKSWSTWPVYLVLVLAYAAAWHMGWLSLLATRN